MALVKVRRPPATGRFKKLDHRLVARMLLDYDCGESIATVSRRYKVSRGTFNYWKPYIGLTAHWLRHVRNLEQANGFLVEWNLEIKHKLHAARELIKKIEPRPKRRSLYSASLQAAFDLTRTDANDACGLAHSVGHDSPGQEGDQRLIAIMRKYLSENPGAGFRGMFQVLLQDEHCTRSHARLLYSQARLQRRWRKKPVPLPERIARKIKPAGHRDQVWSIDFLTDALPTGKRYYVLSALDDYSRECVFCKVLPKATAKATIQALESMRLASRLPGRIRSDNGGQFKSRLYRDWTDKHGVNLRYSRPWHWSDNAIVERFNRTIRQEVLDWHAFRSLAEAQRMLDDWRVRYNYGRPHMALQGLSPLQFQALHGT